MEGTGSARLSALVSVTMGLRHCPGGLCFILPLAEDREGGRAMVTHMALGLIHALPCLHLSFHQLQQRRLGTHMQGPFSWRNVQAIRRGASDCDAKPSMGPQPVTYRLQNSGVFILYMGTPMTPNRRLRDIGIGRILEVLCKFAKDQNIYYYC